MADQYEEYLSQLSAEDYWDRIIQSGWLDDIPESQHQELRRRTQEAFNENPLNAYSTLIVAAIDSESIFGDSPYSEHIEYLAEVSKGVFDPENVQEVHVEEFRYRISFELGGKVYEYTTQDYGDYLDEKVFDLINRALREAGEERQFLMMPIVDQCYYFVCVKLRTYKNAERLRVIPPYMYFEYRESTPHEVDQYLREYYQDLEGE